MTFFLQQTLNGVVNGAVLALFALGFSLVLSNLRIFHVAHEGVFAWGAIAAWFMMETLGLPFVVGAGAGILFAATLNVVLYFFPLRPLAEAKETELRGFVASIGSVIILIEVGELVLKGRTVRFPFEAFTVTTMTIGSISISSIQILIVMASLAVFLLLRWLVERTSLGRAIRAAAFDRELSALLGVNVDRVTAGVFALSGALGGLAAVLLAVAFNVISADMGATYLLLAVAVTVVGGFGSVKGTFIAGMIVGLAASYTTAYLTSAFQLVVVFALMMGFLVMRPSGLFRVPQAEIRA